MEVWQETEKTKPKTNKQKIPKTTQLKLWPLCVSVLLEFGFVLTLVYVSSLLIKLLTAWPTASTHFQMHYIYQPIFQVCFLLLLLPGPFRLLSISDKLWPHKIDLRWSLQSGTFTSFHSFFSTKLVSNRPSPIPLLLSNCFPCYLGEINQFHKYSLNTGIREIQMEGREVLALEKLSFLLEDRSYAQK